MLFGYVEVSKAPGTIGIAPHSPRHSFDFSHVNTSHVIDHLSFGLELDSYARRQLPEQVRQNLLPLDDSKFIANATHLTQEHHVNVVPTSFTAKGAGSPTLTYQFTSTSHKRTKDTLPSMLISYDVAPIQVQITHKGDSFVTLITNLCAIIGGAFSIFGILDGVLFTGGNAIRKKIGKHH